MPPVQNDASDPEYSSKNYNGAGAVKETSGTPGTTCYMIARDSAVSMGTGLFYLSTVGSVLAFMLN